jgi:hypothetical protein
MCGKSAFWLIYWPAGLQFIYVSIGIYLSVHLLIPCGTVTNLRATKESKTLKEKKFTFVPRGFVLNLKKKSCTTLAFNKNASVKTNAGFSLKNKKSSLIVVFTVQGSRSEAEFMNVQVL